MVCFLFTNMQPMVLFARLYHIHRNNASAIFHPLINITMKKISLLIVGLMILGVSACRKVTNEYYTTPNQTIYTPLTASSWVKSTVGGNETYSADIKFVNTDIYENGFDGVLVYLSYDNNANNTSNTWEPIPQTYEGLSYSYIVTQQKITIQVQPSSGTGTFSQAPGAVNVKIVMIPSDI